MNAKLINQEIVERRKGFAQDFKMMQEKAMVLLQQVSIIKQSPLITPKPEKIDVLERQLASLCSRLDNKVRLFENGTITIAVAGVEKSGKSTMLKCLTGIDLPTSVERCTAVSCEIMYAEPNEREYLDIIYYTKEELSRVVEEQLAFLRKGAPWKEGHSPELPNFGDIAAFALYPLPTLADVDESSRTKYKPVLDGLHAVKKALVTELAKLGSRKEDSIANLGSYASHETKEHAVIALDQALIKKIIVHTHFEGGSTALRLCDTPGVDDPNPQALKRTIRGLREETDILVLLNRPGNMPDVTEPLANFFERLKQVDIDSPIRERTIFLINWDKKADPTGEIARLRMEKIGLHEVFPPENMRDPLDVTDKESLLAFFDELSKRLSVKLPEQDRALVKKLQDEWKTMQAEVRRSVYDEVKDLHVGVEKLSKKFHDWFSQHNNGLTPGFIDRLRSGFGRLTKGVESEPGLKELNNEVLQACKEGKEKIDAFLKENVTEENCLDKINSNIDPFDYFVSELSHTMNEIVKNITGKIVKLAPLVQEKVYQIIYEALDADDATAELLCAGETTKDRLRSLCDKLRRQIRDERVATLVANFEEFVNVNAQMSYITRYELRPALNMFDPLRWSKDRRKNNNDLARHAERILSNSSIKNAKEAIDWLKDIEKSAVPSSRDAAAEQVAFIHRICDISFKIVCAVVLPSNKILALLDDFLSQASQSLSTQRGCEQGWYEALVHESNLPLLFPDRAEKIRAASAHAEEHKSIIANLDKALD